MGTLAPLFVVLVLPELWKNRSSGALEIECTAYYSLRQIYAARMVLFGLVDLALLTLFFSAALLAGQATPAGPHHPFSAPVPGHRLYLSSHPVPPAGYRLLRGAAPLPGLDRGVGAAHPQ